MIRIGAGRLAGRSIEQPKTIKTRPMTQKVRASIFDRLGDIEGLTVLDAYAGSGALGIEALSRGAAHVTFIEKSRTPIYAIRHNLEQLNLLNQSDIQEKPVHQAAKNLSDRAYDIIIADPPYAQLDPTELNLLFNHLVENGIGVVSHASRQPSPSLQSVDLLDARTYGDTTISYYRAKIS